MQKLYVYNIIYIYNYIYILTKRKKSEIVSKNGRHRKSSTRNHVWISNCLRDQIVRQCWVSMGLLPMFDHITWLVVWNIFNCPYIGKNHPNWLSYCSEGFKPPIRLHFDDFVFYNHARIFSGWNCKLLHDDITLVCLLNPLVLWHILMFDLAANPW